MDMTGAAAAVNRAPCTMMTSSNSKMSSPQVVGNRLGSVSRICVKPRRELLGGSRHVGHVLYYKKAGITAMEMASCGGLSTEKIVKKDEKKKKINKKMKLLKGLSMLSQAELAGEDDPEGISKAAETLMQHLEEMKRREKALKKKRKMEKSLMKALKNAQCQSSSSESSDSECGEVVDLKSLNLKSAIQPEAPKSSPLEVVTVPTSSNIPQQLEKESCNLSFRNAAEPVNKMIEVCMGGKCKKSDAAQLVEEFEKVIGVGSVVGCKCMGKCRDGPNVRVLTSEADVTDLGKIQSSSLSPPPLCVGVGLEDVGVIVANFLGGGNGSSCADHVNLEMAAAT